MFCLETKNVDERTFKGTAYVIDYSLQYLIKSSFPFIAVNDACIVYDHRIVIDSNNSTNDSHILAAGSVTKYSRFYRTEWYNINLLHNSKLPK